MLDDVKYPGADPYRPQGAAPYVGDLDDDQLTLVANLLAHVPDDKLIVVVLHIPLKNDLDATPENNLINRSDLFKLLEGRCYILNLSGTRTRASTMTSARPTAGCHPYRTTIT